MTEGDFVDMIVGAGLVVEDDEKWYHVKREYNGPDLISFSRDFIFRSTEDDIAQTLAFYTNAPKYRPLTLRGFFKLLWRSLFQRRTS